MLNQRNGYTVARGGRRRRRRRREESVPNKQSKMLNQTRRAFLQYIVIFGKTTQHGTIYYQANGFRTDLKDLLNSYKHTFSLSLYKLLMLLNSGGTPLRRAGLIYSSASFTKVSPENKYNLDEDGSVFEGHTTF